MPKRVSHIFEGGLKTEASRPKGYVILDIFVKTKKLILAQNKKEESL